MIIENFPTEIYTAFNKVKYYDEPHKYYVDEKELISVTTLLHEYQEPFDEEYWSQKKGEEYNIPPDNIKYLWQFINEKGTGKGSIIHDYTENLFLNKIFPYPKEKIINNFGFDPILKEYEITKRHVDQFYKDSFGKLIPIRPEFVVYDDEFKIGGMIDMLFYNLKTRKFQLFDWKTNKKFTTENNFQRLLGKLSHLEDCDLEIYSLQLQMYKYIIEKYTSIKLDDSYLVWFSHNNLTYKLIKTKDRSKEVEIILNDFFSKN